MVFTSELSIIMTLLEKFIFGKCRWPWTHDSENAISVM